MIKVIKKIFILLLIFIGLFVGLVFYAKSPALSKGDFSSSGLIHFKEFLPDPSKAQPPSETVRLVTYNIGYASGNKNNKGAILSREKIISHLDEMAKALEALHPDVMALQEVDFDSDRSFRINQLEYLARALKMPYTAYVVTWNKRYVPWPYWPIKLHFGRVISGQAILSRFPLSDQRTFLFSQPKKNPFWYNWFYLDRIAERVLLRLNNQEMGLWNIHLEAFDEKTRQDQAMELARLLAADEIESMWVLGDFNSASRMKEDLSQEEKKMLIQSPEALNRLIALTDLKNAEKEAPLLTMPSWNPIKKIDHILYSDLVTLIDVGVVDGLTSSDHLPVWADFTL